MLYQVLRSFPVTESPCAVLQADVFEDAGVARFVIEFIGAGVFTAAALLSGSRLRR